MAFEVEQMVPRKSEWTAFPTIVDFNKQTADQAVELFQNFVKPSTKVGELLKRERSQMLSLVRDIYKNPDEYKDLNVRVGRSVSAGQATGAVEVYSVMLEVNGQTEVLTMRVGQAFIEMSFAQNDKLREIVTEMHSKKDSKEGEITYEKFI